MRQTILWTVLPKGVGDDGSSLHLSVLVSPRLDTGGLTDPSLGDFGAFEKWPEQPLTIFLRFGDEDPVPATPVEPQADPELWAALFPRETPVRSFVPPDFSQRRIRSFPVGNVLEAVRRAYAAIGTASPTELPAIAELHGRGLSRVATVEATEKGFQSLEARRLDQLEHKFTLPIGPPATALDPGPPDPPMDFFRALYFHGFRGGDYDTPPRPPEPDFHEALAYLGSHPSLLRRLGLLIDVAVPYEGQDTDSTVYVARVEHDFPSDDQPLKTHYALDVDRRHFVAAPRSSSDLDGGMLRLGTPDHIITQVDVDGAALRAIQYANQLYLRAEGRLRSTDSPSEDALPALRTGGIAVARTGRAVQMSRRFGSVAEINANLDPSDPPELWAEDLTRGYRVDVEEQGVWRSLCQRSVTYHVGRLSGPDATIPVAEEEGVVSAAATQEADPAGNDEFFLHENLFTWDGWSLVAPRPGEVIQPDGESYSEDLDADGRFRNPSTTSLELRVTAEPVQGSLPRLRFGSTYRLRARAVDVAGNSVPLSSDDDSQASPPLTYRRFEPVESPTVVIVSQQPLSALAGESANRPVIRTYNPTPAHDGDPSPESAERLLLPPRTSVEVIERFGLLDTAEGVDARPETWQRLADKDEAMIPEVVTDPTELREVPYLADPFAVAAVLRGLPGDPQGSIRTYPFDATPEWWQGKSFRIQLVEGSGEPDWQPLDRVLTVALPKATIARVLLSSQVSAADLEKLAVWKWIEDEAFDEEDRDRLRKLALEGRHWMLTPFRELTLVHAVQQPLAPPVIESLRPRKLKIGDTFAALEGTVGVHGPSTGRIDLLARWSEPTGFGFDRREGGGQVFDVPISEAQATSVPWDGRRHELGDTRYRRVDYYAVATTRFRDYYEPDLPAEDLTRPPVAERPPHDRRHVFSAEVLNSARPLAPNLLYVLPTFAWEAGSDERGTFSRRRGGLRIYLEEPWFSSGDGELLGVVIWPGQRDTCFRSEPAEEVTGPVEVPDDFKPYTTQWGRDPIWLTGRTQQVPSLQNFSRARAVELGLTLDELKRRAGTVGVAGHEVGYDEERSLFYCDLEIDAGDSYFPFVRLALVRYQPRSIAGAELSRVVVADFAQFAPDRIAWAAREPDDPQRLQVTVSGTGYRKNRSFDCTSEIEVRLERLLGEGEGSVGWVPLSVDPKMLRNVQALETLGVWQGSLRLPPHPPDARLRVVIEEYECFLGDVPEAELPDSEFGRGRQRRLVYSDTVEIAPEGLPGSQTS